jgi:hypothetical protein
MCMIDMLSSDDCYKLICPNLFQETNEVFNEYLPNCSGSRRHYLFVVCLLPVVRGLQEHSRQKIRTLLEIFRPNSLAM